MLKKAISISILLLGTILLSACKSSSDEAHITGTLSYLQRIALPPDAVVTVKIEDTSKADVVAEVIGEQIIQTKGNQVPFAFSIPYNAKQIEENHRYSLQVRIEDGGGKLLFINDAYIPVITSGNPTQDIEIILVQVGR